MPEVQRSFYCDSISGPRYFTYIADELPKICEKWFRFDSSRTNTFIAGESMGGYGAVKVGLSRPERFSGIASLSGVLNYPRLARQVMSGQWPDLLPQALRALHGAAGLPSGDEDVISLACQQAGNPQRPRLIQLCGTSDFLYEDNQAFRRAAEAAGYGHMYLETPGDREWPYWDKAIQYAFQFFRNMDMKTTPIY